MPYIANTARAVLDDSIDTLNAHITQPGQVSYAVTRLVIHQLKEPSFFKLALYIGVLIVTALELWWRVVRPYEDSKRETNGDVYRVYMEGL